MTPRVARVARHGARARARATVDARRGRGAASGRARATTRDDDADATARARRDAFWETFWETLDAQRGKAPFMKARTAPGRRGGEAAPASGGETTTTETTETTRGEATTDEAMVSSTSTSTSFWGRCTIGGLVLAVLMTLSASSLTHWPTVAFAFANPTTFAINPSAADAEAKIAVVLEIGRRLAKPCVRYLAAWFALRSRWRLMWATFAASCAISGVTFA
jgi:hypothetical protein